MTNSMQNYGEIEITLDTESGETFVDSRIIADRLGIEHDNFIQTIQSYQTQIESAFGILLFETGKIAGEVTSEVTGRGRPQKFVFLSEDQATFVMTLSRNSPEVVQCKIDLVKSFAKAKKTLLMREPTVEPTIDPIEAKIQQAIALAAAGPLAVEAFKILHGIGTEPKPAKESKQTKNAKAPIAPPLPKKSDDEVISEFLADLKILIDAGIVGSWNVTTITRQFKPYIAVALQTVIPAMEKHFKKSIDRKHLEAAIKASGGVNASTQRFKKDGSERKTTQAKCALLPDRLL